MKYLSLDGLSNFLQSLQKTFALKNHKHTLSELGAAASGHNHDERYYTESEIDSKLSGKANTTHNHDDRYYTETEINNKLATKANSSHTHTIDTSLSDTSTNPVQNKVINSALAGKVPTTRTINGKPLTANISITASDVGADASGAANSALTSAKSYTDGKIANLLNNSTEAVDSITELANAMNTNKDAIKSLETISASKAAASDLTAHKNDAVAHITASERTKWNNASTHAGTAHAPSNAEANQNAFSNVTVGSTTIAADTKTDTLTIAGSNVTLTPDAANDKLTIGITKANVTSALGYTPPTSNTTYGVVSTTANGLAPKRDGSTNKYLRADGTWAVPPDTNTTYGVGGASTLGLTKLYAGTGSAVDGTMTQNAITSALNGKAASSHNHSAANITSGVLPISRGGTGTDNIGGLASALNLHSVTTSGTGAAYTAQLNNVTSLTNGLSFTMIPHVVSQSATPTLNVNGLGAKPIRQRLSDSSGTTVAGGADTWLRAGKPVRVTYDGAYWIVDFTRPNASNIYGTIALSQLSNDIGTVAVSATEPKDPRVAIWVKI